MCTDGPWGTQGQTPNHRSKDALQTFLPFPDLAESAAALDDRRLGKQRVEALQILRALHIEDYGWARHPAVLMWRGHELALVAYGLAMVAEWIRRGHGDQTEPLIAEFARPDPTPSPDRLAPRLLPPWWGCEALHRSHRAALARKDRMAYAWLDVNDLDEPYVWPEPPAPAAEPRPLTAWLIRVGAGERAAAVAQGRVDLPMALCGAAPRPKQRRQIAAFTGVIRPGDPIALTDGAVLDVGEVAGGAEGAAWPVAFAGRLRRGDLERPWQLQDPRSVGVLRGEEVVRAAIAHAGAE